MYGNSFMKWLFFGVLIVYAPLLVSYLFLLYQATNITFPGSVNSFNGFEKLIYRGELLLICIPICGACIGDLIFKNECTGLHKFLGGCAIVLFFFITAFFIVIFHAQDLSNPSHVKMTFNFSYGLTAATLILSLAATLSD